MTGTGLNFNNLFDSSCLPEILPPVKTLSKEECKEIFDYFCRKLPKVICEFGTQHGCSTQVFLEMTRWLNLSTNIHSWDVIDVVKYVDKKDFSFHLEDISGREKEVLEKYNPDFIFLDCHVFSLTKNVIQLCLDKKINFMLHDVVSDSWSRVERDSNNFSNFYAITHWEIYLMTKMVSSALLEKNYFENDILRAKCVRDRFGICIVEMKR